MTKTMIKKIYFALVAVLLLLLLIPKVEAANKAKVYMFSRVNCSACESALEYFNGLLDKDEDLFELVEMVTFDASGNVKNQDALDLMLKVLEHYDEDTEKLYTPTIVIGDYHNIGFPKDPSDLKNAIDELNKSEEDIDTVKTLAKEEDIEINSIKKDVQKENSYDALIVIGIFVVLIGGFVGLVVLGKK